MNMMESHDVYECQKPVITLYNACVCSTVGVFSTVGDIMSTVEDILSTVGSSVPWGIMINVRGYLEYRGGVQYHGGYLEYRGGIS